MSPRKLSECDRHEILDLYRNTNETTSTLATRFGVSSSTISRFLKNSISEPEYEDLIQAKRLARTAKNDDDSGLFALIDDIARDDEERDENSSTPLETELDDSDSEHNYSDENLTITQKEEDENLTITQKEERGKPILVNRQLLSESKIISHQIAEKEKEEEIIIPKTVSLSLVNQEEGESEDDSDFSETEILKSEEIVSLYSETEEEELESVKALAEMYGEDMADDDDEDDDDEDDDEEIVVISPPIVEQKLSVLPFNSAKFPKICYLVIDRYAELMTKPLKDFSHLGNIPSVETSQKTLPVFDNHKVAKRYCDRKGKVIKVPDGKLLEKTSSYLKAKGISCILMDGKIYSLN